MDAAAAYVEVPLIAHDKEEDVPSRILRPKPEQEHFNPRRRSRLEIDEKENRDSGEIPKMVTSVTPETKPVNHGTRKQPRKSLQALGKSLQTPTTVEEDGDYEPPRKMIKLKSLQTKTEIGPPKRATRKQKRVQLKQLFEAEEDVKVAEKKLEKRQKTKQKSVKLLLTATDHVWGPSEATPDAEPSKDWREINLDALDPLELIGRSCKVFWPLDESWYIGALHEYNSATKKHRIDYADNMMEWICLAKERVQFQMSIDEEQKLKTPVAETSSRASLDVDELVLLAHELENCEEQIGHGTVVWAKVKGWPVWPAIVLDEEHAAKCGLELPRKPSFAVQFFGSCDFARLSSDKVVSFAKGVQLKYHVKCKRPAFEQGMKEVERYLKRGRLPEKMAQMVEMHSKNKCDKDSDAEEFIGDERQHPTETSLADLLGSPLDLCGLRVLSLGKVVDDSEHFHDKHYVWPEGYTSVRPFPSLKEIDTLVEYRMEVIRSSTAPSFPRFRVTPADSEPLEGSTPGECWQKIYKLIEPSKKVKRKSGLSMFGFNNPRVFKLIQRLSNTHEPDLPKGYKPIELQWKHAERCNVCYLEEEYVDNLFLQCAKCRLVVHMTCYGETEPSSDGLWLCQQCQRNSKRRPICSLCPVSGGALKKTTDGGWSHLTCAMWIPEVCILDVKKMEPVDGLFSVPKERWKLQCCVCAVPYGACIQCAHPHCLASYHPLCARAAGFCMEVLESASGALQLQSFCSRHRTDDTEVRAKNACAALQVQTPASGSDSGCARCQPYSPGLRRRSRQEPEAQAQAVVKRTYVEKTPYLVGGLGKNWSSCRWRLKKVENAYKSIPLSSGPSAGLSEVVSMSGRLEWMRSTVHCRITFGKSGIHGWGIFSKQPHQAGDMVVEYAGEIVRRSIADIREHRHYDSLVGAGTYMFKIDEERVVDSTRAGNIAHLINHSCEPNCYSRIVTIHSKDSIIIFAKRDIKSGEELTYDYRFSSKGEDLECNCGAAYCRGIVQSATDDTDGPLLVPSSQLLKWPPPS